MRMQSLPAWAAWIEIFWLKQLMPRILSLPAWAAWIEISKSAVITNSPFVAARMGSVD